MLLLRFVPERRQYRLFEQQGYDRTTTAEIAAAAEVSTATFFNHFATKEDLLLTDDGEHILRAGLDVLAAREDGETVTGLLRRAMHRMLAEAGAGIRDPAAEPERIRLDLITSVPSLRATALQRAFDAQQRLSVALCQACDGELDEIDAAQTAVRMGIPLDDAMRRSIDLVTA